jgi:hypothetical protein
MAQHVLTVSLQYPTREEECVGRAISVVVAVLSLGLWILSASRNQQGVANEQTTVQAQLTAVSQPTPTATP